METKQGRGDGVRVEWRAEVMLSYQRKKPQSVWALLL